METMELVRAEVGSSDMEPVDSGMVREAATSDGFVRAESGVPYKAPPEKASREGKCQGRDGTCGAWARKGEDFCPRHDEVGAQ